YTTYLYPHQFLFILLLPPPPKSTLFPYTTLFRSRISRSVGSETKTITISYHCRWLPWSYRLPRSAMGSSAFWPWAACCLVASSRSEEHTSELQSRRDLVCRLLLEKKNNYSNY